jgi:serine/threonine protein kinase
MSALPPQTPLHDGAFLIESVIGRGGFGITYRARDLANEREVALKECFPPGCERCEKEVVAREFWAHSNLAALQNRFRAQAQRLTHISHPNLARVWDCFDENGTVYLVMELAEGPTLLNIIESREVSVEEALLWTEKLALALGALHDGGLLHLDVKPENIVLRDQEPVLLDFDLVQPHNEIDVTTRPLSLALQCGTPGYAPLEQYAQTAKLSPASDIYALGATFYHLLTGQTPLGAIDRAAGTPLASPLGMRPLLAPSIDRAVSHALEIKAEARPASMREFIVSLREPPPTIEDEAPDVALAPQLMKHGTAFTASC